MRALLELDELPDATALPVGIRYAQSWAAYDAAQVNEGERFERLLREQSAGVMGPSAHSLLGLGFLGCGLLPYHLRIMASRSMR